jgi:hypothetical protein
MSYLSDFCSSFEDICEKLDNIQLFSDFKSLKHKLMEYHSLICKLKLILNSAQCLQKGKFVKFNEFKEKIIWYENKLETLKSLNYNHDENNLENFEGSFHKNSIIEIIINYILFKIVENENEVLTNILARRDFVFNNGRSLEIHKSG